jgi:hypothetical protein
VIGTYFGVIRRAILKTLTRRILVAIATMGITSVGDVLTYHQSRMFLLTPIGC